MADRKKSAAGEPLDGIGASIDRAWVHGFLTALNAFLETDKDLLDAIDADTVAEWMDRYCTRNPKKDVIDGGLELFLELRKITR